MGEVSACRVEVERGIDDAAQAVLGAGGQVTPTGSS
jgi:hypothetical protein